ncbi:MAG TPA: helix-turn-helix transcriptional regulator [Casimicrobiaceae bacterium]
MTDTQQMIDTLKRLLKTQGLTYAAVASRLGLSEASVKRLFSERTFTLKRLDEFCAVLEIDVFELARLARGRAAEMREMTDKQEQALAQDAELLGVFYLLLSEWTADEIVAHYELPRTLLVRLLVRLDRLGLIELLPNDRVRLKVPKRLRLHQGGPIHRVHGKRVIEHFTSAEFDRIGGQFRFEYRELSKASYELMHRRLDRVAAEFLELAELDAAMPSRERETIGLMLAMRPWALSLVTGLKRRAPPMQGHPHPQPAARPTRRRPSRARART